MFSTYEKCTSVCEECDEKACPGRDADPKDVCVGCVFYDVCSPLTKLEEDCITKRQYYY